MRLTLVQRVWEFVADHYGLLSFALMGITGISAWLIYPNGIGHEVLMTISSTALSVWITVALIERFIERDEEKDRQRFAKLAHRRIHIAMTHHLDLWANVAKASMAKMPERPPETSADLMSPEVFENYAHFDANGYYAAHSHPWAQVLAQESKKFRTSMEAVLEMYSAFLSVEELELIEACAGMGGLDVMFQELPAMVQHFKTNGQPHFALFVCRINDRDQISPFLLRHLNNIDQLCKFIGASSENGKRLPRIGKATWSENVAPKVGSSRIEFSRI